MAVHEVSCPICHKLLDRDQLSVKQQIFWDTRNKITPVVVPLVEESPAAAPAAAPVDRQALETEALTLRNFLHDAVSTQPELRGGAFFVKHEKRMEEIATILGTSVHERPPPPPLQEVTVDGLTAKLRAKQNEIKKAEAQEQKFQQSVADCKRLMAEAEANIEASKATQRDLQAEATEFVIMLSKMHSADPPAAEIIIDYEDDAMHEDGITEAQKDDAKELVKAQIESLKAAGLEVTPTAEAALLDAIMLQPRPAKRPKKQDPAAILAAAASTKQKGETKLAAATAAKPQ